MFRVKSECEKQFYKNNRVNFALTLLSLLLGTLLNTMLAFMTLYFIEAVEKHNEGLLKVGAYISVAYLITYWAFSILRRKYKNAFLNKALSQFKDYIFEKMLHKSVSQFGEGESSKFISAFSNDLASIENNYLVGSLNLILTILQAVAASIALLWIEWKLTLPAIIMAVFCCLFAIQYGKRLVHKEAQTSEENMGFVAQVKDLLNGFVVIKSFRAENEVLRIFRKKNVTLEDTKEGRRMTSDMVSIVGDISSIIINTMIVMLGVIYSFKGFLTIGKVIACVELANFILYPVRDLGAQISNRNAAIKLIDRLAATIEAGEKEESGRVIETFNDSIELKNVAFSYEEDKEVLKGIDIRFEKGKNYAIVGGSGSGKSTIFKLLLGYYKNYSGELLIDGVPMKDIDLDSLYQLVSIIQQEVFLFDSTIRENITMFREFDQQKVEEAIEKAGLASLIQEKGDDYYCGEGGKNLSGGEKQRVSIARCLVRQAPVLLMDEVTAALDNQTSLMVESQILDIKDVTKIIITHRMDEEIMKRYDKIFVMSKGHVIEEGTFEELMDRKKYFYSLYNIAEVE